MCQNTRRRKSQQKCDVQMWRVQIEKVTGCQLRSFLNGLFHQPSCFQLERTWQSQWKQWLAFFWICVKQLNRQVSTIFRLSCYCIMQMSHVPCFCHFKWDEGMNSNQQLTRKVICVQEWHERYTHTGGLSRAWLANLGIEISLQTS